MLVAVDTGGTKTLVGLFNSRGEMTESVKFPTPRHHLAYISELADTISEMIDSKRIDAISIALPGMIKGGTALWCGNLGWENIKIGSLLKKHFDVPIFIENDGNLAGLAETKSLPKRYDNSVYLTFSTGIGMGLIIDHQIHPALAVTEPGHMLIEYEGRLRKWETFASGKSIYETYGKFARDIHSERIWKQIADKMSRGLLTIIPAINPDIIILGGSIGTYYDRYSEPLLAHLREQLDDHIPLPEFRQAVHPEEAVVYGCYYHALNQLAL